MTRTALSVQVAEQGTEQITEEPEALSSLYTPDQLALLDENRIPQHIAIIMDGNRRWAMQRDLHPTLGHWEGAEVLVASVEAAIAIGIKAMTVYAFSTENWDRSQAEIDAFTLLLKIYLLQQREHMIKNGVRLNAIGNTSRFPPFILELLDEVKEATSKGTKIDLILALNYGARDEIRRACEVLLDRCLSQNLKKEDVTEELLSSCLDTAHWPDPELLIRTGGEMRLSNFLLWQLSYAEVYVTQVLWPDFSSHELLIAILEYQKRKRRFGG